MTIEIEIEGTKKEIEKYFNKKIYSKPFKEFKENAEKQISDKLNDRFNLSGMKALIPESIKDESRFTMNFSCYKSPKETKKTIKK